MHESTVKYAVGYTRSAVKDPTGEAISRQEKQIQQYCQENNLILLNMFKDNGASGNTINRRGWTELMGFINQNKGIVQSLVVANVDRIARDYAVHFFEEENLKENYGITIQATNQPIVNDLFKLLTQKTAKKRGTQRPGK
jgi:DNA invertase Pin-like site-specific DNA recombinase